MKRICPDSSHTAYKNPTVNENFKCLPQKALFTIFSTLLYRTHEQLLSVNKLFNSEVYHYKKNIKTRGYEKFLSVVLKNLDPVKYKNQKEAVLKLKKIIALFKSSIPLLPVPICVLREAVNDGDGDIIEYTLRIREILRSIQPEDRDALFDAVWQIYPAALCTFVHESEKYSNKNKDLNEKIDRSLTCEALLNLIALGAVPTYETLEKAIDQGIDPKVFGILMRSSNYILGYCALTYALDSCAGYENLEVFFRMGVLPTRSMFDRFLYNHRDISNAHNFAKKHFFTKIFYMLKAGVLPSKTSLNYALSFEFPFEVIKDFLIAMKLVGTGPDASNLQCALHCFSGDETIHALLEAGAVPTIDMLRSMESRRNEGKRDLLQEMHAALPVYEFGL